MRVPLEIQLDNAADGMGKVKPVTAVALRGGSIDFGCRYIIFHALFILLALFVCTLYDYGCRLGFAFER